MLFTTWNWSKDNRLLWIYNYIVQDLHFRKIAKFSKGCKEMRKLQNLRQPTIKKNKWQRTNVERQILVKKQQRHQNGQIRKRPNHSLSQLPQTHRLPLFTVCKRRCNAISAEQLPQKPWNNKQILQHVNKVTRNLHRLHKYTACTACTSSPLTQDAI